MSNVIEIFIPEGFTDTELRKLGNELHNIANEKVADIYREKFVAEALERVYVHIALKPTPNSRSTKDE